MLWQLLHYYFFLLLTFCLTIVQSDSGCSNQQNEVNLEERKRFNNAFPFLDTLEDVFTMDNGDGIYIGELFNCSSGIKHGWGEMRWANGTLYGPNNIFYYSEGDRYYGQWNLDIQEGTYTLHAVSFIRNVVKICLVLIFLFCTAVSYFYDTFWLVIS